MHTDGNNIAGLLQEIFCREMTVAERTCQSCGHENAIGAHLLYESAGAVLRCPNCGDVGAVLIEQRAGYAVTMRGTWRMARPA